MVIKVGIPAVMGATGGVAIGFFVGGPAGAVSGGQFGASLGLKIGTWIWGASTVEGMAKKTLNKALSIAKVGAKYLLAGGLVAFAYWGTSKNTQESCTINPQHQICQIFPYVNFGLQIFSTSAIIIIISKSIFNIYSSQKEIFIPKEDPRCSFSAPFCSTAVYRNPFSCVVKLFSCEAVSKC